MDAAGIPASLWGHSDGAVIAAWMAILRRSACAPSSSGHPLLRVQARLVFLLQTAIADPEQFGPAVVERAGATTGSAGASPRRRRSGVARVIEEDGAGGPLIRRQAR
jgi:hypothetical protein